MARKKPPKAQVPDWIVTFADLMAILMCFFVLILSFSHQDEVKLQVVAGSMREAFGTSQVSRQAAVVEREGNPERPYLKAVSNEDEQLETQFADIDHDQMSRQGMEAASRDTETVASEANQTFALAAASLRQAWRELPDITAVNDNLIVEVTEEGLDIQIVDQEGRPMFPEGSKYPYEVTRQAMAVMAPLLQQLPNPIRISGHTAAGTLYANPRYGPWELSFDRANTTRQILEEFGLSGNRIHSVVGMAETNPYFANDPYLAANQRIKITVMFENPPVPADLAI